MDRSQPHPQPNLNVNSILASLPDISYSKGQHAKIGITREGKIVTRDDFTSQSTLTAVTGYVTSWLFNKPGNETFETCQQRLQQYLKDQVQQKKLHQRKVEEKDDLDTSKPPTISSTFKTAELILAAETIPFEEGAAIYANPEDNVPVPDAPGLRIGDLKLLRDFIKAKPGNQRSGAVSSDHQADKMVISLYQLNEDATVALYQYISTRDMNDASSNRKAVDQLEPLLALYYAQSASLQQAAPTIQPTTATTDYTIIPAAPFTQQPGQTAGSYMQALIDHAKHQQTAGNEQEAFKTFQFVVELCKREDNPDRYDTAVRSMVDIKIAQNSPVTEDMYPLNNLREYLLILQGNGDILAGEMINKISELSLQHRDTSVQHPQRMKRKPPTPQIQPRKSKKNNAKTIPVAPIRSNAQQYTYEVHRKEKEGDKTYQRTADATQKKLSELYGGRIGNSDKILYDEVVKNQDISEQDLDNLEYRVENDHQVIQRKILAANQVAAQQGREQNPEEEKYIQFAPQTTLGAQAFTVINNPASETSDILPQAGIAAARGDRYTMEDAHTVSQFSFKAGNTSIPVTIVGIFDGHGGSTIANNCAQKIVAKLKSRLEAYNDGDLTQGGIWNALKLTPVDLDRDSMNALNQGTTACVALMIQGHLWVMNVGDSRAVLALNNGESIQLSEDAHFRIKYDYNTGATTFEGSIGYLSSVDKRGGVVTDRRVYAKGSEGSLNVFRSIGDHAQRGAVSARSKVTCLPVTEEMQGAHLMVGCDGIFDKATSAQVAQLIHYLKTTNPNISSQEIAEEIVSHAYHAGSSDNLSAIVVPVSSMNGES